MRFKALVLVAAVGAMAVPASAQSYRDACRDQRGSNQAAGVILGSIVGGVLGSNVAARGHRSDGTALGAVLGGVVGSQVGRGSANCDTRYAPNSPYPPSQYGQQYGQPYGYGGYPDDLSAYGYERAPDYGYRADQYDRDREYGYGDRGWDGDRDHKTHHTRERDVYAQDRRDYIDQDFAGRDCSNATQITRLPDGTEIRRTVDACRNAYYGGWKVED